MDDVIRKLTQVASTGMCPPEVKVPRNRSAQQVRATDRAKQQTFTVVENETVVKNNVVKNNVVKNNVVKSNVVENVTCM